MSVITKLQSILSGVLKYGALATAAVTQVEQEVGAGNGQTKKQLAVSYVLAAAHAGESVGVPVVQEVSAVVEMAAGVANALGLFGKPASGTVAVPNTPTPAPTAG